MSTVSYLESLRERFAEEKRKIQEKEKERKRFASNNFLLKYALEKIEGNKDIKKKEKEKKRKEKKRKEKKRKEKKRKEKKRKAE